MSGEFDKFAKSYDQVLRESMPEGMAEDGYFARYKVDLTAKRMRGRAVDTVLDFGCGIGRSLGLLRDAFPAARITGFDESPRSIDVAKQAGNARLTSDWDAVSGEPFDCIFVANVFHHIAPGERVAWLERCGRALSARGRIFWFEHNPLNPVTRHIFEHCPFDVDASMIARDKALDLMKEAGLRATHSGYTLFFPRPLAFLRPLEPMLRRIPLGAQYYIEAGKRPEGPG